MTGISEHMALVNVGLEKFYNELKSQNVEAIQVDWRPPALGKKELINVLCALATPEVDKANEETVRRMKASRPLWVDVQPAIKVIPGMQPNHILHSGPKIEFERMCDPQQRAVEAAAIFEGWCTDKASLEAKLKSGDIQLANNYAFGAAGAMCGVITPSMPVLVVENREFGTRSWTTFNEGKGMGQHPTDVVVHAVLLKDDAADVMLRGPLVEKFLHAA